MLQHCKTSGNILLGDFHYRLTGAERRHVGLEEKEAAKPCSRLQARCVLFLPQKQSSIRKCTGVVPAGTSPVLQTGKLPRDLDAVTEKIKPVSIRYNFLQV